MLLPETALKGFQGFEVDTVYCMICTCSWPVLVDDSLDVYFLCNYMDFMP